MMFCSHDLYECFNERFLTRLGYPCFGFDYRGFEASEGNTRIVSVKSYHYLEIL